MGSHCQGNNCEDDIAVSGTTGLTYTWDISGQRGARISQRLRMCRLFLNALFIGLGVGFSNALRIENISEQDNIVTEPVVDILEHSEDIPEYIEEDLQDVSEDNSVVSNPYQVPAGWSLMLYSLQAQLEHEDDDDHFDS